MSELDEKLNALLSDPGKMAQVMQLAQQLSGTFGDGSSAAPLSPEPGPLQHPPASALDGVDLASVMRFLPLIQELNHPNQQATQLLNSLRPFLKKEKQEKIQRAVQLARIIHVGKKALTEMGGLGHL